MIRNFSVALIASICLFAFNISAQTNFQNNAGITINDAAAANPYPSNITVSGLGTSISKVTVTLRRLTHAFQDDAGFLLVGPTGVKVRIMTDCGGNNAGPVTLTFDDAAAAGPTCNAVLVNGIYKPTLGGPSITGGSVHPANFPAPAPANPYSLLLSSFNGTNPNGTWSLYVDDDTGSGAGTLSGWSVTITTVGATAAPATIEGRVSTSRGRGISKAMVNLFNPTTQENKIILTNPFGYFRFTDLPTGELYLISIKDKRYNFVNSTMPVQLSENTQINFVAEPEIDSSLE